MLEILAKIKGKLSNLYKNIKLLRTNFRLEEIDVKSKKVIISRRGMQTILKIPLVDAVTDRSLLSNLSSDQACWLGYYCGKMCRDVALNTQNNLLTNHDERLTLDDKKGKYRILTQDRRGNISYYNLVNKTNHTVNPLTLINNQMLINEFDPSQACYIGILAGLLTQKQIEKLKLQTLEIKPLLKLVK